MSYQLSKIVAAAALAMAGAAHAAPVTIPTNVAYNGTIISGSGTLSFSEDLVNALNVGLVTVAAVAPATVTETYEYDSDFEEVVRVSSSATAPITSITVDNTTNAVLNVTTAGGALQTAPKYSGISLGGTLAVTNLNVDLTTKRIYASLTGNFTGAATGKAGLSGGAITTIDNFYLWDFANITGPTQITGPGMYNNTITGLTITQSGFNHFVSALRLVSAGVSALSSVQDYGSITSTLGYPVLTPPPTIPEPSTYALAITGLAVVGALARQRRQI